MGRTAIEWTQGDDGSPGATWNPVRGCSRVSEGCRNCYAERQAVRRVGGDMAGFVRSTDDGPRWTGKVELVPERLDQPLRWRRPRRVFVNSMSDLFHEALPDEAIDRVFAVMAVAPRHTFQVLTKRPDRMRAYIAAEDREEQIAAAIYDMRGDFASDVMIAAGRGRTSRPWPFPNVWLGVSVENQAAADERIHHLRATPAAVRFLSVEPLLGPIDLSACVFNRDEVIRDYMHGPMAPNREQADAVISYPLDWIIVGGESGPGARPCNVAWIRAVVAQCKAAGVACFVKQLGAVPRDEHTTCAETHPEDECWPDGTETDGHRVRLGNRKGGDPSEWPEDLRVREFPEARRA